MCDDSGPMMLGYFDVIMSRDDNRRTGTKPVRTGLDKIGMFDGADADQNAGLGTAATGWRVLPPCFRRTRAQAV